MQTEIKDFLLEKVSILLKGLAITIVMCMLGYFLLVVVYCIPSRFMEKHTADSYPIFLEEGVYPVLTGIKTSQLDNSTDALMLLVASYPNSENAWKAAASVERYRVEGKDPVETLLYIYDEMGSDLEHTSYSRYWHGYLVLLKPLLSMFNYGQVRFIIMLFQLSLFLVIVAKLTMKRKELIFPLFFMWIFMNPIATMCSLQFNNVTILTFIAVVLVIHFEERWKGDLNKWELLFLVIGALTSYFDLLTYPLLTLGIPLLLWLSFYNSVSFSTKMEGIIFISIFWAIGYGGMWAGKWIIGSIVTGENVIQNAVEFMQVRTSSLVTEKRGVTYWEVIKRQLLISWRYVLTACLLAFILILHKIRKSEKIDFISFLPYVLVGAYPLIWYGVLKNHSYIHAFFTYRELSISIVAFLICATSFCKEKGDHPL